MRPLAIAVGLLVLVAVGAVGAWLSRRACSRRTPRVRRSMHITIAIRAAGGDREACSCDRQDAGEGRPLLVLADGKRQRSRRRRCPTGRTTGSPRSRPGAGRRGGRRRRRVLLPRPRRREVGRVGHARGDPGRAERAGRGPGPDRDRRHLDGRLRRARHRTHEPGPLLRGRRPFGALWRPAARPRRSPFDDADDFARHPP